MPKIREISLIALLALFAAGPGFAQQTTPVMIEYGLVQGVAEADLTVYRGMPFAAPPVGDLRWRAPQPAAKWEGVRPADKFGPDPYQGDGKSVSEDCLYVNVWTPAKSANEKVPVLVWIYGGDFSFGSTSTPVHNGGPLARKGVVLVSINDRMAHGVDVPYIFQTLDSTDPKLTAGDCAISETVSTYWTNFAQRGDPNGPGVPACPECTAKNRPVMHFHNTASVGSVPSAEALARSTPISRGAARQKARLGLENHRKSMPLEITERTKIAVVRSGPT